MKNLLLNIQEAFIEQLQAKNSWGKNEVANLYLNVSNNIMAEHIQQNDATLEAVMQRRLDRKGRDKDPFPNSAHSFTEGSELPPLEDDSLCGKFSRVNPDDYKNNPLIDDGNGDKS